jgi:hypothetical protein
MTIKRCILNSQIAAAVEINAELKGWGIARRVLASLSAMNWEDESQATLAKTAVLNQLYSTNVMAVSRMASHIERLSEDAGLSRDDFVETVSKIAALDGEDSKRKHWVFASKYAHFFIDPDKFPIYDRLAADVVLFHTGERKNLGESANPYKEFCDRFFEIREKSGLSAASLSEMDSYLWFAGCYRRWLRRLDKAAINREVKDYLTGTSRDGTNPKEALLRRLVPEEYICDF